jgi:Na+-driven multidrug efflux pump
MAFTSGLLAVLAFSPLIMVVYTVFPFTLSPGLAAFAITPTYIFVLLPALQVWNSYLKGLMINSRYTRAVSVSTFIEVASLVGFSWVFLVATSLSGVNATFIAFILGRLISSLYLYYAFASASAETNSDPFAPASST